ncbi:MAG: fumarylacetoacetate hydrolase family protein [Xanthomonadales bacterium]|jgi:fumarylpyruvate hydrolase|nr:fumarylacetoacetate hydrolase family protein [Xanthomonadales bacterium]
MSLLFDSVTVPSVAVAGSAQRFPVHRIYCIGRNYAEHAREMGAVPEQGVPIFFLKPADAVCEAETVPYPPGTANLHHEVELVVALASGGREIDPAQALTHVYGYAVGNDLTRRDLQVAAKAKGNPWDVSKSMDHGAPISPIRPATEIGHPSTGRIWLSVNGETRQQGDLSELLFPVAEVIHWLSRYFELKAGDLIFTGTPAGVGPLRPGDGVEAGIEGVGTLRHRIG